MFSSRHTRRSNSLRIRARWSVKKGLTKNMAMATQATTSQTTTSQQSKRRRLVAVSNLLLLLALFLSLAAPHFPRAALARDTRHGDYVENGRRGGAGGGGAGGASIGSSSSSSSSTRKKPVAFASTTSSSSSSSTPVDFNSPAAVAARKRGAERALAAAQAGAAARSRNNGKGTGSSSSSSSFLDTWRGEKRLLSWSPRAFLVKDFLTDDECDYLIEKASPKLEVSTVVDAKTGESLPSKVRTSSGTFFDIGEDAVIESIERRIAITTGEFVSCFFSWFG